MRLIHSEDKNLAALQHALDLKSSFGVGASAMVLIYNATGDTLEMVDEMDWRGDIYHEHPPLSFENGQWISFLHVRGMTFYCEAARVYRGHDIRGQVRDYMVAWSVPWDPSPTSAYTEVHQQGSFPGRWDYIHECLLKAGKVHRAQHDEYCTSTVSIGGYTSAECIAVLNHKFSP
ncbi:hypothetical protein ACQ4PT_013287 [Festuca glaucescens]